MKKLSISADDPSQHESVDLDEDEEVAEDPEEAEQQADARAGGGDGRLAQGGLGVKGPAVVSVEVRELPTEAQLWDQAEGRREPFHLPGEMRKNIL